MKVLRIKTQKSNENLFMSTHGAQNLEFNNHTYMLDVEMNKLEIKMVNILHIQLLQNRNDEHSGTRHGLNTNHP